MHYIRCLRPPKVLKVGGDYHIELLFIISTDLGDSLLYPDEPIQLTVTSIVNRTTGAQTENDLTRNRGGNLNVVWKPGQRVVKQAFKAPAPVEKAIDTGRPVDIAIGVAQHVQAADSVERVLGASDGLIMPLHVTLNPENDEDREVSLRKIRHGVDKEGCLNVAEDIGEPKSLARHVWDGGAVAASAMIGSTLEPPPEASTGPCVSAFKSLLASKEPVSILELGCGVGVLGLGAAVAAMGTRREQETVMLMTDLEDAEEQVRGNLARNEDLQGNGLDLLYENLDWEDGRHGQFGPLLGARRWNLIMFSDCTYNVDVLPALVGTLDALHTSNLAHSGAGDKKGSVVFMATKPRHSSEEAVFELLAEHNWTTKAKQTIALPVLGAEDQSVQLYLLEKSGSPPP